MVFLFFIFFSMLVVNPKSFTFYTMANPAGDLLNAEKWTKRENPAAPPLCSYEGSKIKYVSSSCLQRSCGSAGLTAVHKYPVQDLCREQ